MDLASFELHTNELDTITHLYWGPSCISLAALYHLFLFDVSQYLSPHIYDVHMLNCRTREMCGEDWSSISQCLELASPLMLNSSM